MPHLREGRPLRRLPRARCPRSQGPTARRRRYNRQTVKPSNRASWAQRAREALAVPREDGDRIAERATRPQCDQRVHGRAAVQKGERPFDKETAVRRHDQSGQKHLTGGRIRVVRGQYHQERQQNRRNDQPFH